MELFKEDPTQNLLPFDGELYYFGTIMSAAEASNWLKILSEKTEWKHDELIMFGKKIITSREVAMYADDNYQYTYSKQTKEAKKWFPELVDLKQIVEQHTQKSFNSCLLNLYHNGKESMGWHSDNESDLEHNDHIASLSFGAERKFNFRHKTTKKKIELHLAHGSLLLMKGTIQTYWQHQLPVMAKVTEPRINLTFRNLKY